MNKPRISPTLNPIPNSSLMPFWSQRMPPITRAKAMQQSESQKPRRSMTLI